MDSQALLLLLLPLPLSPFCHHQSINILLHWTTYLVRRQAHNYLTQILLLHIGKEKQGFFLRKLDVYQNVGGNI
jgi:hypothetical protein